MALGSGLLTRDLWEFIPFSRPERICLPTIRRLAASFKALTDQRRYVLYEAYPSGGYLERAVETHPE